MTVSTACSSSAKVFAHAARAIRSGRVRRRGGGRRRQPRAFHVVRLQCALAVVARALPPIRRRSRRHFHRRGGGLRGSRSGSGERDRARRLRRKLGRLSHVDTASAKAQARPPRCAKRSRRASLEAADIGYVNLHGTASRANDAAEDVAVYSALGDRVLAGSTKGWTGHALGAAGIVEAVVCMMALADGWVPGTLNCRNVDAQIRSRIVLDPVAACAESRHDELVRIRRQQLFSCIGARRMSAKRGRVVQ